MSNYVNLMLWMEETAVVRDGPKRRKELRKRAEISQQLRRVIGHVAADTVANIRSAKRATSRW